MVAQENCRICGARVRERVDGLRDDRYGFPALFALDSCERCGHAQLRASFSRSELETLYSSYYPRREFELDAWRPLAELHGWKAWFTGERGYAFRWVPRGIRVLDIGCGLGQTLGYHRARGCVASGVEADGNAQRVAERFGLDIRIGVFEPEMFGEARFDYITMDQVIEHVTDPLHTLKGVARLLAPGGTVVLSTPNAGGWGARVFRRKWINWHTPYHLQFFSHRSMSLAAEHAGLRVISGRTITSSEWLYYQWQHLLLYPGPAQPSAFWAPNAAPRRSAGSKLVRIAQVMHRLRINHWITRLADGVGLGDNFLFILRAA